MNTTQTNASTIQETAKLAQEIAASMAFDYAGNYGRGTFRFEVTVRVSGNVISLHAVINACIRKERARKELEAVWLALKTELANRNVLNNFTLPVKRGKTRWLTGDFHMGCFHEDGLMRQLRVKAV